MEDIKIGEYVRTKNGLIGILKEKTLTYPEPSEWVIDINGKIEVIVECQDYPVKHSTNIIDLIEVGDYVNGYKVINFAYDGLIKTGLIVDASVWGYDSDEIRTILTKEQYKGMAYKVEEV